MVHPLQPLSVLSVHPIDVPSPMAHRLACRAPRLALVAGAAVAKEALELLDAPECPKTRTQLLLAPDQMMLQIHESIGHPLELDRILGDERNYAGTSFVAPPEKEIEWSDSGLEGSFRFLARVFTVVFPASGAARQVERLFSWLAWLVAVVAAGFSWPNLYWGLGV